MSGPKRNPDKLNTIGIVVVGVCGAVLVYVTITALQAFYVSDTAGVQAAADYGNMDQTAKGKKADELRNITEPASNPGGAGTYRIKIDDAMKLVVEDAKRDPTHLGGAKLPPATKETIPPAFGRPKMGEAPAPETTAPAGAGSAAAPAAGSAAAPAAGSAAAPAAGSAAAPAAGSAAANPGAAGSAAPQPATGTGPGAAPAGAPSPAGSGATR